MSKKKKRLKYLKKLKQQKDQEQMHEEQEVEQDLNAKSAEDREKEIVDDEKKSTKKSPEKAFEEARTEKGLIIFLLAITISLIFIPGEILNKISIFINKIIP
ncbi:MAG: hypothetical protein KKH98_07260 [Spirochaetes bacterium]|nr:hypothetical protein [Spirochaetota bacterium]